MAKDYAKYATYRKSRSFHSRFWILGLTIGLLLLGCTLFFFKFHHKKEMQQTADKLKQKLLKTPAPKPPEPEFDFYNILPQDNNLSLSSQSMDNTAISSVKQSNVDLANEAIPIIPHLKKPLDSFTPTPEQVAMAEAKKQLDQEMTQLSDISYILVLGDFQSVSQAERYQAQALLRGFSARSKVNNANGRVNYQIFMGPYSSVTLVSREQKRLNEAGIHASLVKLK